MLDGIFYYFTGTGVVVGVQMEEDLPEEFEECDLLDEDDNY